MAVEVHGFIVTHFPYHVHKINNVDSPEVRSIVLQMDEGDLLDIKGIGIVEVTDFEITKRISQEGNEIRELYISTYPATV